VLRRTLRLVLRVPVLIYRYGISPFTPGSCRHLPTCSEYASEAVRRHGGWNGFWLAFSRIMRCHPWGSHGFDPVPEHLEGHFPWWQAWRHGRWSGRHIRQRFHE
jgi:putative membrane protein insertion efficiency factor